MCMTSIIEPNLNWIERLIQHDPDYLTVQSVATNPHIEVIVGYSQPDQGNISQKIKTISCLCFVLNQVVLFEFISKAENRLPN